jgi:hypothetical protein
MLGGQKQPQARMVIIEFLQAFLKKSLDDHGAEMGKQKGLGRATVYRGTALGLMLTPW